MVFTAADACVSVLALGTLAACSYKARAPFKKHSMHVFSYLMLILIVYGLAGKTLIADS